MAAWKIPDDFENLCAMALMACGQVPHMLTKGGNFSKSTEAAKYRKAVRVFFLQNADRLVDYNPEWTPHYRKNYTRYLANQFFKWCNRARTPDNQDT